MKIASYWYKGHCKIEPLVLCTLTLLFVVCPIPFASSSRTRCWMGGVAAAHAEPQVPWWMGPDVEDDDHSEGGGSCLSSRLFLFYFPFKSRCLNFVNCSLFYLLGRHISRCTYYFRPTDETSRGSNGWFCRCGRRKYLVPGKLVQRTAVSFKKRQTFRCSIRAVSYTHLTLPTIYSV